MKIFDQERCGFESYSCNLTACVTSCLVDSHLKFPYLQNGLKDRLQSWIQGSKWSNMHKVHVTYKHSFKDQLLSAYYWSSPNDEETYAHKTDIFPRHVLPGYTNNNWENK